MDALSQTLRVVHLVGAIFVNARFTAPWCYRSQRADSVASLLEPGAERFQDLVGTSPIQYLTQWRMQVASRLLRDGRAPVAAIALEVGYDSEAAFARAFKRAVGKPPAAWRRDAQSRDGAIQSLTRAAP